MASQSTFIQSSRWKRKQRIPPATSTDSFICSQPKSMTASLPVLPQDSLSNQDYLDRQAQTESNARSYPRKLPVAIRRAEGLYVSDVDGRVFMDCLCGAGTLALGHNHPSVVAAIRKHLDEGYPLHSLDLTSPVKHRFVEELFSTLPAEFASTARIQFCSPSGSDAVEAAIKLVKTATGRSGMVAFRGGYHGQTHGALALMGNLGPKVPGLMPGVQFHPYPYAYRCAMGKPRCTECTCAQFSRMAVTDPERGAALPAGMILEAVQGEGGVIPAPVHWLRDMRRISDEKRIPLIIDEVQTGWGRTGSMYAFEHSGILPDVLVLSKAIGGGLPLAVVVYREELDVWKPGAHAGTFRGNQLAMATGLATLEHIRTNDILSNVQQMSARFMDQFLTLQQRHHFIGDVRGRGLMLGMEIIDPDRRDQMEHPKSNGENARKLQAACFAGGLIVELGGRDGAVMRVLPPLNVTAAQVDAICGVISRACQVVDGQMSEGIPECGRTKRQPSFDEAEIFPLAVLSEACTATEETCGVGSAAE
jgi:diaminobutyrate-2-oxoglutarate transaminase